MFNLTETDVNMTHQDFCNAVVKICNKTWIFPPEFNTISTDLTEKLETLHKDQKDLIDGAINHYSPSTISMCSV